MKRKQRQKKGARRSGVRVTLAMCLGARNLFFVTPDSLLFSRSLSLSLSLSRFHNFVPLPYYYLHDLHDLLSSPLLSWQAKLSRRVSMIDRIRQEV